MYGKLCDVWVVSNRPILQDAAMAMISNINQNYESIVDSTEVSPRDFAIVYDNKATNIESILLLMEVGELDVAVADEESTVWAYELQNDFKMAKYFDLFTELSTGSERPFVVRVLAKDLHAVTTVFSETVSRCCWLGFGCCPCGTRQQQ
jgi:hypothetical protein